MHNFEFKKIH